MAAKETSKPAARRIPRPSKKKSAFRASRARSTARTRPSLIALQAALTERFCEMRRAQGVTQAVIAARAGIDLKHYSLVEGGKQNLTIATVWGLAIAFGVSLVELFRGLGPDADTEKLDQPDTAKWEARHPRASSGGARARKPPR